MTKDLCNMPKGKHKQSTTHTPKPNIDI